MEQYLKYFLFIYYIDNIKTKIKNIQNDNLLSNIEKNTQIQNLMNVNYNKYKNTNIICEHYLSKKCDNFYFSCCNIFSNCLRCHNDINNTHKPILQYIRCKECKLLHRKL